MSSLLSTPNDVEELFNLKSDVSSSQDNYDPLKAYKSVNYSFINDNNNNSYSAGRLTWDLISIQNQFVVLADSYLRIPIDVKCAAGGTAFADGDGIAFKNSVLDLITGVQVQAGNGSIIVNEPTNMHFINKLRLALDTTFDGLKNITELQYEPDSVALSYTGASGGNWLSGKKVATNENVDTGASGSWNEGFSNRIKLFKRQATFASNTFSLVVYIPLRYIHPFFKACDMPLVNNRLLLTFFTPITNSTSAVTVNAPLLHATNNAAAATMSDAQIQITGTCRLYYKRVQFDPATSKLVANKLAQGMMRRIQYNTCDVYKVATNQTSAIASVEENIVPSVVAPVCVWRLAVPTGEDSSQTIPFQSTQPLTSANLLVNNINYYDQDLQEPEDFYEILRSKSVSHGKKEMHTSGLVSYNDWLSFYRVHCFDISRLQSRLADPNQPASLFLRGYRGYNTGTVLPGTLPAVDVYYLVEHSNVCDIKLSNSDIEYRISASYM